MERVKIKKEPTWEDSATHFGVRHLDVLGKLFERGLEMEDVFKVLSFDDDLINLLKHMKGAMKNGWTRDKMKKQVRDRWRQHVRDQEAKEQDLESSEVSDLSDDEDDGTESDKEFIASEGEPESDTHVPDELDLAEQRYKEAKKAAKRKRFEDAVKKEAKRLSKRRRRFVRGNKCKKVRVATKTVFDLTLF